MTERLAVAADPCPFCGSRSTVLIVTTRTPDSHKTRIKCESGGALGPMRERRLEHRYRCNEALYAWNDRATVGE